MPPKKPLDDAKVMDVSKPGSTKPIATSRPVVTTLGAVLGIDKQPENLPQPVVAAAVAPSQSHRVIAPINEGVKPDEAGEQPAAEAVKPAEPAAKPESTPAPEAKNEKEDDGAPSTASESAQVDALAENVASKKAEEKALEEEVKKEAAVQELIDTKKYFVPLAHDSTKKKKSKAPAMILIILVVVLLAGYAVVDEGIVDPGFDVPYHVLKK